MVLLNYSHHLASAVKRTSAKDPEAQITETV